MIPKKKFFIDPLTNYYFQPMIYLRRVLRLITLSIFYTIAWVLFSTPTFFLPIFLSISLLLLFYNFHFNFFYFFTNFLVRGNISFFDEGGFSLWPPPLPPENAPVSQMEGSKEQNQTLNAMSGVDLRDLNLSLKIILSCFFQIQYWGFNCWIYTYRGLSFLSFIHFVKERKVITYFVWMMNKSPKRNLLLNLYPNCI